MSNSVFSSLLKLSEYGCGLLVTGAHDRLTQHHSVEFATIHAHWAKKPQKKSPEEKPRQKNRKPYTLRTSGHRTSDTHRINNGRINRYGPTGSTLVAPPPVACRVAVLKRRTPRTQRAGRSA